MILHWRLAARRLAACCAVLAATALAGCAAGINGGSNGASSSPSSHAAGGHGVGSSTGASSNGGGTAGSKSKIAGIVQFALPPAGQGCSGAKPFPFLIDTGAQGSVLTASLATRLGLPKIGPPVVIGGAGCSAKAQVSRVTNWNVAGMALRPQFVTYLKIPLFGGRGEPDGLLGSDVWSRFGAMRLDFARGDITVPSPEQPGPASKTTISRPSAAPVPAALLHARPAVIAPMTVTSQPGSTAITVKIRFGTQPPLVFAPDTGASQSAVDTVVAKGAGLASAHARIRQGTVCTVAVFPEVKTGPWSVAGLRLRPQVLGVTGLLHTAGVAGLIGSDQMSRFGSVIFDYAGGRLVLGAG